MTGIPKKTETSRNGKSPLFVGVDLGQSSAS